MSRRRTEADPAQATDDSGRLRDWHALALLFAAVMVFFRDIVTQRAFFWEDFITQAYPFRTFASVSLANGELPLWNPYTFAGMPFQADIQSAVFYLPNIVLPLFVRDGYLPFHVFELSLILHYWIAGVTMYFLAKEFGLERGYALFSGLMFALSGFLVVQAVHPAFVQQLAWFPLILLLLHRALSRKSPSYAIWTGLAIGLSLLAGAPQITLFLVLLLALYALFFFLSEANSLSALRGRAHALWLPLISFAVSLGVAAIQLLPTLELQPLSERASMTFEQAQHGRLDLQLFLTGIVPRFFGEVTPAGEAYWGPGEYGTFWETCFYVGIPGLFAILFSVRLLRRVPVVRFLLGVALLAFLLALGNQFVLHRLFFDYAPGFNTFRGIGRATVLATFTGALLGGFGLRAMLDLAVKHPRRIQVRLAGAVLLVALLWALIRFRVLFPGHPALDNAEVFGASLHHTSVAVAFTILFAVAGLLFARGVIPRGVALSAILLLQFADAHTFGYKQNNGDLNGMTYFTRTEDQLLRAIKEEGRSEFFRVASRTGNTLLLDRNHGLVERIFLTEGYTPLKLVRVVPPATTMSGSYDLLNAKYRAAVQPETGASGLVMVGSYLPRAFMVYDVLTADDSKVQSLMLDSSFNSARTVVLEEPLELPIDTAGASAPHSATITSYKTNRISLDVQTPRRGVLLLSEIYYPGWIATVDGRPAPVLRANWSLRAIPVPAGSQHVDLRFMPAPFFLGALISVVSLIVAFAALIWLNYIVPILRKRDGERVYSGDSLPNYPLR